MLWVVLVLMLERFFGLLIVDAKATASGEVCPFELWLFTTVNSIEGVIRSKEHRNATIPIVGKLIIGSSPRAYNINIIIILLYRI